MKAKLGSLRVLDVWAHLHNLELLLDLLLVLALIQIGLNLLFRLVETVSDPHSLRDLLPILRTANTGLLT